MVDGGHIENKNENQIKEVGKLILVVGLKELENVTPKKKFGVISKKRQIHNPSRRRSFFIIFIWNVNLYINRNHVILLVNARTASISVPIVPTAPSSA